MFLKKNPTIHIFNPFLTSSEKILSKIRETLILISRCLPRFALAVRGGASQLGYTRLPLFSLTPSLYPLPLSLSSSLSSPLPAHGSRTARARLARARLLRSRFQKKCLLPMGILNKKFQIFQTKSDFFPIGKIRIQNVPNLNKFISSEPDMS